MCPVDYVPMALWITVLRTCGLRSRCSLRISGFAPAPLVGGGELEGTKRPKGQRDAALDLGERTLAKKWICAHFSQRARLCSPVETHTCSPLHASRSANPSYSGKSLRSKVFHSAELSGFVRLALLAENPHWQSYAAGAHMQSFAHVVLRRSR